MRPKHVERHKTSSNKHDARTCQHQRHLRFSGMLSSVDWQLVTDVSGQPIGAIFKRQAVLQEFLVGLFDP
jgi:hypothetical protein